MAEVSPAAITTPACNEKPSWHARRRSAPRTVGLVSLGDRHVAAASAWTCASTSGGASASS
jgi:hypothetical protein